MTAEVRVIIAEQTVANLLRAIQGRGEKPDVVEFAEMLEDARQHDPSASSWYNASFPELLLYAGRAAMGEDADILTLEYFANAVRE